MISVWSGVDQSLLFAGADDEWLEAWRAAHHGEGVPVGVPMRECFGGGVCVHAFREAALEALRTGEPAAVAWESRTQGPGRLTFYPVRLADGSPAAAGAWRPQAGARPRALRGRVRAA